MRNSAAISRPQVIQSARDAGKKKGFRLSKENLVLAILVGLVLLYPLAAIFAPWISPYDPADQNLRNRLDPPSAEHLFGTDQYGRDVFTRVLYGARTTLFITFATVVLAGTVGLLAGISGGYKGGKLDDAIKMASDVLMTFPTLLLGLMILAVLGPGTYNLIIAATLALIPKFLRVTRGMTLSLKEKEYILGARAVGAQDRRIIMGHIFPNIRGTLLTFAIIWIAEVVRMEAGLSFLGIGIQPPTASWGLMIREGFSFLNQSPWMAIMTGLVVVVFLLLLSLLSSSLEARLERRK